MGRSEDSSEGSEIVVASNLPPRPQPRLGLEPMCALCEHTGTESGQSTHQQLGFTELFASRPITSVADGHAGQREESAREKETVSVL